MCALNNPLAMSLSSTTLDRNGVNNSGSLLLASNDSLQMHNKSSHDEGGGTSPRVAPQDDLSALLYIVVTLLFYSMGIVVGIITYLKRERADMEEDKMFDIYMAMKRDPFNLHRQERVRLMARRLRRMERAKAELAEKNSLRCSEIDSDGVTGELLRHVHSHAAEHARLPNRIEVGAAALNGGVSRVLNPLVLSSVHVMVGASEVRSDQTSLSLVTETNAKHQTPMETHFLGSERRGALLTSCGKPAVSNEKKRLVIVSESSGNGTKEKELCVKDGH